MAPQGAGALHVERVGTGDPVVLLHGFTQTGRLWGRFGEELSRSHELVLIDLPGHGGSSEVRADLWSTATLLDEVVAGIQPFSLVGYSLGGRVALHLALARPERVRRLVLIGATAGIEDSLARARRRARDEAAAAALEADGDLAGFLERWLANPMFAGLSDSGLDERRRNTPAGLASSLRLSGTGTQQPLWGRLAELAMPVLALAGADDPRFARDAGRLADGAPFGAFSLVPGAGHAAHFHQPLLTTRMVRSFFGVV